MSKHGGLSMSRVWENWKSWNCELSNMLKSSRQKEDDLNSGNQYYGKIEQYKLWDRLKLHQFLIVAA